MTKKIVPPTEIKESPDTRKESTSKSRRKALGTLVASGALAGVALPNKWKTPMINSVVLPAHAGVSGDCSSPACTNVSVDTAVINPNGNLFVFGMGTINACCVQAASSPALDCALLSGGTTIGFEESAGTFDCASSSALVSGCIVSCSVVVSSGSHSISSGNTVTLRFDFGGACVCSETATVVQTG